CRGIEFLKRSEAMTWRETLLGLVVATSAAAFLPGQDLPSSLKALADRANQAAEAKPSDGNIEKGRADLQKTTQQFKTLLHTSPDRQKIDRWQKYVQWDDLKAAAKGQKSSSENAVDEVAAKMRGDNTAAKRVEFVAKLRAEYDPKIEAENDAKRLA